MLAAKLFTQHRMLSVHGEESASRVQHVFAAAGGRLDSIRPRRISGRGRVIDFHLDLPTVKTLQATAGAECRQ